MDHDTTEPVAGTYPDESCLTLLTETEAREVIEYPSSWNTAADGRPGFLL
jgi:hypothetical protein